MGSRSLTSLATLVYVGMPAVCYMQCTEPRVLLYVLIRTGTANRDWKLLENLQPIWLQHCCEFVQLYLFLAYAVFQSPDYDSVKNPGLVADDACKYHTDTLTLTTHLAMNRSMFK